MESGERACFLEAAPTRTARLLSRLNSTSMLRTTWNECQRPAVRASHWPISICGLRGVTHLHFFERLEQQLLNSPSTASPTDAPRQLSSWISMAVLKGLLDADITLAKQRQDNLCDGEASVSKTRSPSWSQHFHRRLATYLATLACSFAACLDAPPHECCAFSTLGDLHNLSVESIHRIAASEVAHLKATNVSFALLLDGIWDDPWPYFPGIVNSEEGDYCQDRLANFATIPNMNFSSMQAAQAQEMPPTAQIVDMETLHQGGLPDSSSFHFEGIFGKFDPPILTHDILDLSCGHTLASPFLTVVFSDGSDDNPSESCSLDSFFTPPMPYSPHSSQLSPLLSEISERFSDLPFGQGVLAM